MRYFHSPPSDSINPRYPCGVCNKHVGLRMRAVKCDICQFRSHIKCEGIEPAHYEKLIDPKNNQHHFCKICKEEMFPFQKVHNEQFEASVTKNLTVYENINLQANPPPRLRNLFTDLNDRNDEDETLINCEYYDYTTPIPTADKKKESNFIFGMLFPSWILNFFASSAAAKSKTRSSGN